MNNLLKTQRSYNEFWTNEKFNQESLKNLIELSEKENPNWHGATKKPLIIIKYGNYTI